MYELGIHPAVAVEAALGETSGGKPQVSVMFEFTDGPNFGRTITWYGFFTEKTTKRTIASLRYCGWQGNDLSDLSTVVRPQGFEVDLDLANETYQEKTRTKVQWVNRKGGAGASIKNRMDATKRSDFAEKMMARVAALANESADCREVGSVGDAPPFGSDRASETDDDDDLPF